MGIPNHRKPWISPGRSWPVLIIMVMLALVVVLRFAHLGRRVYWFDEVIHTTHSFGYDRRELAQAVKDTKTPAPLSSLDRFRRPNPERSAIATIEILADSEPQSPPLHYILNRWWSELLGPSVSNQRLLAAIFGLGLLPATYWLSCELGLLHGNISPIFPWLATLFVALSPLQVLYSREVRLYSLWCTLSISVTAASLWAGRSASRSQSLRRWSVHTLLLTFSVYTFPLEWVSAIGRTAWLLINRRSHWRGLAISQGLALIAFIPWALAIQQNIHKMGKWREISLGQTKLILNWIKAHGFLMVDWFPFNLQNQGGISLVTGTVLVMASGALLWWLWSRYRRIFSLLICVSVFPWFVWAAQDLIQGGSRSNWTTLRYYLPGSALFSIAFALGFTQLTASGKRLKQCFLCILLVLWISLGLVCTVQIVRSQESRFAFMDNSWVYLGRSMRDAPNPLIVIPTANQGAHNYLISVSQYLPGKMEFVSLDQPSRHVEMLQAYDSLYVIAPKLEWREQIEADKNWSLTALSYELFLLENNS